MAARLLRNTLLSELRAAPASPSARQASIQAAAAAAAALAAAALVPFASAPLPPALQGAFDTGTHGLMVPTPASCRGPAHEVTISPHCGPQHPPPFSPLVRRTAMLLQNQEPLASSSAATGPSGARPLAGKAAPPGAAAAATAAPTISPGKAPAPAGSPQHQYSEHSTYAVYSGAAQGATADAPGGAQQCRTASLQELLAALPQYDVVLLGEYHDDPVAHHLQYVVLRHALATSSSMASSASAPRAAGAAGSGAAAGAGGGASAAPIAIAGAGGGVSSGALRAASVSGASNGIRAGAIDGAGAGAGADAGCGAGTGAGPRPVVLSLEMFERDVQCVMDEYLSGRIRESDLLQDGRPWPNYQTDYRPLVELAKQHGTRVACANAPRRYVSMVGRSGAAALQALPAASLAHLPPLPYQAPSELYVQKIRRSMAQEEGSQPAAGGAESAESTGGGVDSNGDGDGGAEQTAPMAESSGTSSSSSTGTASTAGGVSNRASVPQGSASSSNSARISSSSYDAASTTSTSGGSSGSGAGSSSGSSGSSNRGSEAAPGGGGDGGGGACPHIGLTLRSNFTDAQALWDAAMAHAIAQELAGQPGALVLHVCGKFHSEQRLGICEHLRAYAPHARVGVVTFVPSRRGVTVPAEQLSAARLHTYGDWLVLTDGDLPRSFDSEHPV